ncbi:MAG: DUF1648 domain-containing protein [Cyanobacteria bacterium]|nr:DUF1648 domain-containing protein [Cyanobacteriota bacterium]
MLKKTTGIALEATSILTFLGAALYTAFSWSSLPDVIPIHFNLVGEPDGWGSKSTLLLFPALTAFIYLLHTAIARYPALSAKWYRSKEENARHFAMAQSMIPWLKAEICSLFAFIQWTIIATATGASTGLNSLVMGGFVLTIFGTIGVHLFKLYSKR